MKITSPILGLIAMVMIMIVRNDDSKRSNRDEDKSDGEVGGG